MDSFGPVNTISDGLAKNPLTYGCALLIVAVVWLTRALFLAKDKSAAELLEVVKEQARDRAASLEMAQGLRFLVLREQQKKEEADRRKRREAAT